MRQVVKHALRLLFGSYEVYRVYRLDAENSIDNLPMSRDLRFMPVDKEDIESSGDALISEQSWYHGSESKAYACFKGPRIVSICFFWHGNRYRTRNFWPLETGEAKLVQVVTLPEERGCGIAHALISYASTQMFALGFRRLFARIWHSNMPSLKAFERAGWSRTATVILINPLRRKKPWRITFPSPR